MENQKPEQIINGLSQTEVQKKLINEGYNEIPSGMKNKFLFLMLNILKEPMLLLLIVCGIIYWLILHKKMNITN